jgi:hypothetical protein
MLRLVALDLLCSRDCCLFQLSRIILFLLPAQASSRVAYRPGVQGAGLRWRHIVHCFGNTDIGWDCVHDYAAIE